MSHGFQEYARTHETASRRVRWVHDEDYQTRGSYAYDTDEETEAAENEELEKLESGEYVALGAIVETRCGECGEWTQKDSLWGIVIGSGDDLTAYGDWSLEIPAAAEGEA